MSSGIFSRKTLTALAFIHFLPSSRAPPLFLEARQSNAMLAPMRMPAMASLISSAHAKKKAQASRRVLRHGGGAGAVLRRGN